MEQKAPKEIINAISIAVMIVIFLVIGALIVSSILDTTTSNCSPAASSSSSQSLLTQSTATLSPIGEGITSSSGTANNDSWVEFDGINDEISIDFSQSINLTNSNFTILFWAKPTGSGERNVIVDDIGGSNQFGIRGSGAWNYFNGSWGNIGSPIAINEVWQHLTYTYDNSNFNASIYFNNVLNQSFIKKPQGDFIIEQISSEGSNTFFGGVNEVRIYNITLTDNKISEIFNSGRQANSSLPSEGLVLWYSFNEGSGTTVYDKSGNGNNGV